MKMLKGWNEQQRGSLYWMLVTLGLVLLPWIWRKLPQEEPVLEPLVYLKPPEQDSIPRNFRLDPHRATEMDWQKVGIPARLARTWAKYFRSGGKIRKLSDLRKLYGMDSVRLALLEPYICCLDPVPTRMVKSDLNLVDSLTLDKIPGIGPVLARRIVRYRDKLGGFVELEQLNEVYGLDSGVIKRIKDACFVKPGFIPRKLSINHLREVDLLRHPYFDRKLARSLVAYRYQHGAIAEAEWEKYAIDSLELSRIQKIKPYLDFSP